MLHAGKEVINSLKFQVLEKKEESVAPEGTEFNSLEFTGRQLWNKSEVRDLN